MKIQTQDKEIVTEKNEEVAITEKTEMELVQEFNQKEYDRMNAFKIIRPTSSMKWKIENYEGEIVELTIKFPSTEKRLEFLKITETGASSFTLTAMLKMFCEEGLIRHNGKAITMDDMTPQSAMNLSGILFQLSLK